MITLRPYQEADVGRIRTAFQSGNRRVLYVLPTGGGKTRMFAHMARVAASKGKRVCILVHREELLKQVSQALTDEGAQHGLIKAGHPCNRFASLQVASVFSLTQRLSEFPAFDLIIVDECHHAVAGSWSRIIQAYPRAHVLGVTATPMRLDGKGLAAAFDCMIVGPSTADLIRMGYLVPPTVYAPSTADISALKSRGGDWAKEQIAEIMDRAPIYGDVIKHWQRLAQGVATVAFCATVAHAENTARKFREAGIPSASIDGSLSPEERANRIDALRRGHIKVLTSCDLISEGFDLPGIGCAVLLRPTKSLALYLQQVGRALRTAAGKSRAVIIDHVGNAVRHGLPQEVREWELTTNRIKSPKSSVTTCLQCYAVYLTADSCPVCGAQPERAAAKRAPARELTKAELTELSESERWAIVPYKQLLKLARTREQLEAAAAIRGFKPGWVYAIMRSRGMRA